MSRDISVDRAAGCGMGTHRIRLRFSAGARDLSALQSIKMGSGAQLASAQSLAKPLSMGVKRHKPVTYV
jgi:hypothetical protein